MTHPDDQHDRDAAQEGQNTQPPTETALQMQQYFPGQSPEITPTPVSSYVTLEQAVQADSAPDGPGPGSPASDRGITVRRITVATALVAALGTMIIEIGRPKTPRPPLVTNNNGNPGGGGATNIPDASAPEPDAGETEKCTVDVSADGRPVREGTCIVTFSVGEDTIYTTRLEKARIMIDSKNYEVEIDYGAVRGIAGKQHPDFLVRGSKHFLAAEMQLQGTIWVQETEKGKVATVQSEDGETLLHTSWGADTVLPEGQYRTFAMEAPEGEEPASCSVRWSNGKPEKDADAWLSMLGALAVMGIARRRAGRPS